MPPKGGLDCLGPIAGSHAYGFAWAWRPASQSGQESLTLGTSPAEPANFPTTQLFLAWPRRGRSAFLIGTPGAASKPPTCRQGRCIMQ